MIDSQISQSIMMDDRISNMHFVYFYLFIWLGFSFLYEVQTSIKENLYG